LFNFGQYFIELRVGILNDLVQCGAGLFLKRLYYVLGLIHDALQRIASSFDYVTDGETSDKLKRDTHSVISEVKLFAQIDTTR
jgi:hypothetical protein